MKTVYSYIIIILSALVSAVIGIFNMPKDNLFSDVITENPEFKLIFVVIIFVACVIMNIVTMLIMSFISGLFYKIGTKDKENFDVKIAKRFNNRAIALLIALNALCVGLQSVTNYIFYAIPYLTIGTLIVYLVTHSYKKHYNSSVNILIATIPLFVYVIASVVYTYFTF